MRDPERLFASNGITDFERELLDAGKNEPMPEPLRQRMEAALGLTGGAGLKPGNAADGAQAAQVTTLAKAMKLVWLSAGVVALGFGGGIVGARFFGARFFERSAAAPAAERGQVQAAPSLEPAVEPTVESASSERRPAQIAPAPAGQAARAGASGSASAPALPPAFVSPSAPAVSSVAVGAPAAPMATPAVAGSGGRGVKPAPSPVARVRAVAAKHESRPARAAAAPARHQVTEARAEPVPSGGDLRVEIDLIDAARGTLRNGSAGRALEILGRYSARFPHGALAPEGVALRVEALMRLGRTAEARALAQRFVAANPTSPLVERMNRLAGAAPSP